MQLPDNRVGPYVRALHAGLNALAPHEDYVPLNESLAHLRALDPSLSGDLMYPAEVEMASGMPSYTWLERAQSEQALAHRGSDETDATEVELARAERLDPALGARLRHRRDVRRHLRRWGLLPSTRVVAAVRRLDEVSEYTIAYDRIVPDGRWLRIRCDLRGPPGMTRMGPLRALRDGRVVVDEGFLHLLTRHFLTPLLPLRDAISNGFDPLIEVTRVSRGFVGPFWFPGVPIPDDVPPELGKGLLLHLSVEVCAEDVHHAVHMDPLEPPDLSEEPPIDQLVFRERRFAGSGKLPDLVQDWARDKGMRVVAVPLQPRRGRRL